MRSALSWGGAGAALKAGDIIHSVNNPPVTTLEQLRTAIAAIKPGHAVVVQVERDGALVGTLSRVTINVGVTRRMLVSIDTASCASAAMRTFTRSTPQLLFEAHVGTCRFRAFVFRNLRCRGAAHVAVSACCSFAPPVCDRHHTGITILRSVASNHAKSRPAPGHGCAPSIPCTVAQEAPIGTPPGFAAVIRPEPERSV